MSLQKSQLVSFTDLGATICQDVTPAQSGVPHTLRGAIIGHHFFYSFDNWKISISLRLNSTVISNEPIECQWRTNVNITDLPACHGLLSPSCDFPDKNVNPGGGGGCILST